MSLILRKKCQEVLDTNGLQNYHTDINDQKCLSIVTECGKPLVDIQGIKFSRKVPTKDEIDYATELLKDFLDTHIEKVNNYITTKKEFNDIPLPITLTPNFKNNYPNYKVTNKFIIYPDSIFTISLDKDNQVSHIALPSAYNKPVIPYNNIQEYVFNKDLASEALILLKDHIEYRKKENTLNDIFNDLNSCKI